MRSRVPLPPRLHTAPSPVRRPPPRRAATLPAAVRARMESRLGHDFSGVRVDTSGQGAAAAEAAGMAAFTRGSVVTFAAGRYAPDTAAGERLLAHELAHVVQQRRGRGGGGATATSLEREAERVAGGGGGAVRQAAPSGAVQGRDDEKKKGVGAEGSFGQKREAKTTTKPDEEGVTTREHEETTKTEGKVTVTVPLWPDGTFGPLQSLENVKLILKAGETRNELKPDDPKFAAQFDLALTLAKLKLLEEPFAKGAAGSFTLPSSLKLTLGAGAGISGGEGKATLSPKAELGAFGYKLPELEGRYGELAGGLDLSVTGGGSFATGKPPTAEVGSTLTGKLDYASPKLPYRPYGPLGPTQHGQFTVGGKTTLSAGYATDKRRTLSAGVGGSLGYQWPSLYGVQPTVKLEFDLSWTQQGNEVTSSHATMITLGAKF